MLLALFALLALAGCAAPNTVTLVTYTGAPTVYTGTAKVNQIQTRVGAEFAVVLPVDQGLGDSWVEQHEGNWLALVEKSYITEPPPAPTVRQRFLFRVDGTGQTTLVFSLTHYYGKATAGVEQVFAVTSRAR